MTDSPNPNPAVELEQPAAMDAAPEADMAPAPEASEATVKESRGFVGLQAFLQVVVIVIFVITFVVQAFQVPTGSMENTLLVGDFLLTDKVHYGSDSGFWSKLLPYRPVRRGDIAVFHFPVDPSQYLVKRVIGLPGDRIHLHRGAVFLNDQPLAESYVIHTLPYFNPYRDEFPAPGFYSTDIERKWRRNLLDYVKGGDLVVPPNCYFVLGDNRDSSLDSRYWGFVPRDNIVGRPLVIYMSVNHGEDAGSRGGNGKLINSGKMPAHFLPVARWDRMFHLVR